MSELHTKHTILEKIFFRSIIYGAYIIAAYSVFLENVWIGSAYFIFIGGCFIIVPKYFCSYCPYPCKYSDCLMLPHQLPKKFSKPENTTMSMLNRLTFPLTMHVVIPLFPQYWLFKNHTLFIIFWVMFIVGWSSVIFIKCRHCRFRECLLNISK